MKLRSLDTADTDHKRVLLRVDFNVTIIKGKIEDGYKILRCLPTIDYLLSKDCQVIILSHLGRPEGKRIKAMTMKPVFNRLVAIFKGRKMRMKFVPDKIDQKLVKKVSLMKEDIIVLENLRYDKREDKNDSGLAKILAQMGDLFINEAFAFTHRVTASTVAIKKFMPCYAGLNLLNEINYMAKSLKPVKPAVAIIGGAKIETKLPLIKSFLKSYAQILVGGAIANTLLKAKGYDIGGSLFDKDEIRKAKGLIKIKKIILPLDVVVADAKTRNIARVVKIGKNKVLCSLSEQILDVGPATVNKFSQYIKKAKTIVWNGPMGLIELPKFSHGSIAIAQIMAARSSGRAVGIVGGGETILVIHESKMEKYFDFISTGGGAMLEYLGGAKLPGVEVLKIFAKGG